MTYAFDQRDVCWFPLGDFKHLQVSMLASTASRASWISS